MNVKDGREIIIKKAEVKDAKDIVEYLNIVGGESDNLLFGKNNYHMNVEDEEKYIMEKSLSDKSALFVGRIDGEVACLGNITSPERERIAHQCEIGVTVKRKFWSLGAGSILMKTIIDFAKQTGKIEIIHLKVRSDNINAIKLYKKLGFEEIGVYKNFAKIDEVYADFVLMNLYI